MNPLIPDEITSSNYYTNYWLENNIPEDVQHHQAPTYISLQQQPSSEIIQSYDYSSYHHYNDYQHHQEDANNKLMIKPMNNNTNNRPLTTSHHVQQLSSLCPPFSEDDNSSAGMMSQIHQETNNKIESHHQKSRTSSKEKINKVNLIVINLIIIIGTSSVGLGRKSSSAELMHQSRTTRLKRKPRVLFSQV